MNLLNIQNSRAKQLSGYEQKREKNVAANTEVFEALLAAVS